MENEKLVLVEIREKIALITINRVKSLNALNREVIKSLLEEIDLLEKNGVIVGILTGSGSKSFVAGADISEMYQFSPLEAAEFASLGHKLMRNIEKSSIIFIAAVNGFALGGGCELALACDFIYASENSKFGFPEVTLGIIPGFGGTVRAPLKIGISNAKELIFTGKIINSNDAFNIGLVQKIFLQDKLLEECWSVAESIQKNGVASLKVLKSIFASTVSEKDLLLEQQSFASLFTNSEQIDRMKKFLKLF
ncbi:enoyl-CoA hydratase/isomerase family protein [bacterium]|nr:enoyl-CoA hydratase/isomerase family protein [bacterium]